MPPYSDAPPSTAIAVLPAAPPPPPATALDAAPAPPSKPRSSFHLPSWPRVQHFLIKNALPLGFLFGLIWALLWPAPGQAVAEIVIGQTASNQKGWRIVEVINNCFVFLVSGLTLRMSDFHSLAKHWPAIFYGLLSILLITPLFALPSKLLPLAPPEFPLGLALFAVVPTTLGVGVALTHAAHGNQALSLLLTVISNLLGVLTVPFLLPFLLKGKGGEKNVLSIDPGPLASKLALTVLFPTLLGMGIRASHPALRRFLTHHKTKLSLFSTFNLVMIIWQTLSAARGELLQQSAAHLILIALAAIVQHFLMLGWNGFLLFLPLPCWLEGRREGRREGGSDAAHLVEEEEQEGREGPWLRLRLPPGEAVATWIMTSQKSAPVAVTVISYLTDNVAQQGLLAIPCLIGQLSQIFIGSVIATKLAVWVDKTEEEKQVEVEMTKEEKQRGGGAGGKGREVEGKEGEDVRLEKGMYAEEEEGDEEDDDEMFGVS